MNARREHDSLVAAATVAVGAFLVLGTASSVLFLAAFQFRPDWFAEPARLVSGGATSAELLRFAAAADLLGYYLPTGVVAYVLWRVLRPRSALVADLSTLAALGYVLAGGAGASMLAMAGPMLMHAHAAAGADQASVAIAFGTLTEVVFRAIWQFLDALLLGGWWVGIGLLTRVRQPRFALLSFALGAASIAGAVLTLMGLGAVRDGLLGLLFIGWFAWAIWLVLLLQRRRLAALPA
jgi:hypothetical protein